MNDGKRKKNYYTAQHNKKTQYGNRKDLEAGMTGFLCTCNFSEKGCVKDAYMILNDYLDKTKNNDVEQDSEMQVKQDDIKDSEVDKAKEDEEDITASLQKEIKDLKSESARRFQSVDTGIKNIVFIQSSVPDPLKLALPIMKDAYETKKRRTRYILRLLPVELVCKAYVDVIKDKADPIFDKYFVKEPKTFAIVFNRHSNSKVQRNQVIEELAGLISNKNPENKVDLKTPELTVVVEIIRSFCLLSVAPNYFLYKKYNITELCGGEEKKEEKPNESESTKGEENISEEVVEDEMKDSSVDEGKPDEPKDNADEENTSEEDVDDEMKDSSVDEGKPDEAKNNAESN